MNPLNQYPALRAAFYMVQWVVNGVLVIAGVVFATLGTAIDDLPKWYVLALAIAPVLWTYLGLTAQGNTPSYRDVVEGDARPPEHGRTDAVTILVVVVLVLVVLALLGFLR